MLQITGINFNDNFAPIVNDVSFRILHSATIFWNLKAKSIDVKTAFRFGNLKEEIFMGIAHGVEVDKDDYSLELRQCMDYLKVLESFL
jgi:Reverse transcriptase (RNA-dependent DNA polymerase)